MSQRTHKMKDPRRWLWNLQWVWARSSYRGEFCTKVHDHDTPRQPIDDQIVPSSPVWRAQNVMVTQLDVHIVTEYFRIDDEKLLLSNSELYSGNILTHGDGSGLGMSFYGSYLLTLLQSRYDAVCTMDNIDHAR